MKLKVLKIGIIMQCLAILKTDCWISRDILTQTKTFSYTLCYYSGTSLNFFPIPKLPVYNNSYFRQFIINGKNQEAVKDRRFKQCLHCYSSDFNQ